MQEKQGRKSPPSSSTPASNSHRPPNTSENTVTKPAHSYSNLAPTTPSGITSKPLDPRARTIAGAASSANSHPSNQLTQHQNIITIDGKRRIETFNRSKTPPLETNPLYDQGFERIGCYLCPAALQGEQHRLRELHPELHRQWETHLHQWAEKQGLPRAYVKLGFWRWRQHPPKIREIAEQHHINLTPRTPAQRGEFSITTTSGITPCTSGGYSIEGVIKGITPDQIQRIINTQHINELGVSLTKHHNSSIKIFHNNTLAINTTTRTEAQNLLETLRRQLTRLLQCTQCNKCLNTCPIATPEKRARRANHRNRHLWG